MGDDSSPESSSLLASVAALRGRLLDPDCEDASADTHESCQPFCSDAHVGSCPVLHTRSSELRRPHCYAVHAWSVWSRMSPPGPLHHCDERLSRLYRRSENPPRAAAWYEINGLATIRAVALWYGLGKIDSSALACWQPRVRRILSLAQVFAQSTLLTGMVLAFSSAGLVSFVSFAFRLPQACPDG